MAEDPQHHYPPPAPGEDKEEQEPAAPPSTHRYKWWIQMILYTILVLSGQNIGTILGRIYFNNGGVSKWTATLVQVVGFPVLFPFQFLTSPKTPTPALNNPFNPILALVYVSFGIALAADCMLYTLGLQYLPVTTYTLICASQLGFNALFSYFLNNQKFTPYIINSLVLLTLSSVMLVFQSDPGDENKASKKKYAIGFLCTVAASAGYALMLSLMQLAFQRIIKKDTMKAIVDFTIYQCLVATMVILIGFFASGDWQKMHQEMKGYKTGILAYVMNLFWTAVTWQAFSIGYIGLVFKVSSLFSNVISILGLPIAPVMAVIILHDKMTGIKIVSMFLAVWGFVSYMYQHYLDDIEMKEEEEEEEEECNPEVASVDT